MKNLSSIIFEIKDTLSITKGYLELMDGSIEKYNKYMPYVIESLNKTILLLKKTRS